VKTKEISLGRFSTCESSSVRPLSKNEECDLCQTCVDVQRATNEIILANSTAFTFDHVFLPETNQEDVYRECIYDMIEGCFQGYSASILAYGQTGSGLVDLPLPIRNSKCDLSV
jgi:hypothetical protein